MKRLIPVLIAGVVFIFIAGCGNDQFTVEKRYWRIQKQTEKIFNNPQASPDKELERVVKALSEFAQDYPRSRLSVDAEFNIARLYIAKEEYDKARAQLKNMFDKCNEYKAACPEALFLIGNSYELEDKWNLAVEQYKKIMQEYPATLKGLDIPIYIASHYKIKYQPEKMISAFQEAVNHYKALAQKYPDSLLAYSAYALAAKCYIELKDWQNAVDVFNTMTETFKGKTNVEGVMMEMALIYSKQLKDNLKAKGILEKLIKEYPRSKLIKPANALLREVSQK